MRIIIAFIFLLSTNISAQQLNWVNVLPTEYPLYFGPAEVAVLPDSSVVGFFGFVDDAEDEFILDFDLGSGEVIDRASFVKYDKNGNYIFHKPYYNFFNQYDSIIGIYKARTQLLKNHILFSFNIAYLENNEQYSSDHIYYLDYDFNEVWHNFFVRADSAITGLESNFTEYRSYWNELNNGQFLNFSIGLNGAGVTDDNGNFTKWSPYSDWSKRTGIVVRKTYCTGNKSFVCGLLSTSYISIPDTMVVLDISFNNNEFVPDTTTEKKESKSLLIVYENSSMNYLFHRSFLTNAEYNGFAPESTGLLTDKEDNIFICLNSIGYPYFYDTISFMTSPNQSLTIDLNETSNANLLLKLDPDGYVKHWTRSDQSYNLGLFEVGTQSMFYLDKHQVLQFIGTGQSNLDYDWDLLGNSIISGPNSQYTPSFASYDKDFNYLGHTIIRPQNNSSYAIARSYQTDSLGRLTVYGEFFGSANFQTDTTQAPTIRTFNGELETEFIATYTTAYPNLIDTLKDKGFCVGDTSVLLQVQANEGIWDYVWQIKVGDVYKNIYDNNAYGGLHTPTLIIRNPTEEMNGQQFRCWVGRGNGWKEAGIAKIFNQSNTSANFSIQYIDSQQFSFQANQLGPADNIWLLGDGTVITDLYAFNHIYQGIGQYTITHIITSECGSDTSEQTITIEIVNITDVDKPNWDVHQQGNSIWIESDSNKNQMIELYTIEGRMLYRGKQIGNKHSIEVENLPKGIYLIKRDDETKKIIIN